MAHIQDLVRSASVTMKSGKPAECARRFASALGKTAALLLALYFFICRLVLDTAIHFGSFDPGSKIDCDDLA